MQLIETVSIAEVETPKDTNLQKMKQGLFLAGKLAQASQQVVNANSFNLSQYISNLNSCLKAYNDYIFANLIVGE